MLMEKNFALKGQIVYSKSPQEWATYPNSYLVCRDGLVEGVYPTLPEQFQGIPVEDVGDNLVIPGLVDLHLHAPQYAYRALGMDLELLDWLNTHTFPEEAKYNDLAYAQKAYGMFTAAMVAGATTRASIFATMHVPATLLLMDMLEDSGLVTLVGKVNMDRNSIERLTEKDAAISLEDTRKWLAETEQKYSRTRPILTPRFIPSCSDALMEGISRLQKETGLPVQSHLSENPSEVEWVKELCPQAQSYADAYARFGLFGGAVPTIMAHCVYPHGNELELLRDNQVMVAHCPNSNTNLSSGIAPVRLYLEQGIRTGLGTDIAGGFSASIFRTMSDAIQVSKLYWRLVDDSKQPLTAQEAFYMGTKGGGQFFGKVGSFEKGYEFDAVVLDDSPLPCPV